MLLLNELHGLSDAAVVEEAKRYVEQRPCNNISTLLRCPEPQKIAGHLRVALEEALRHDATRESFATPAPAPLTPPDSATIAAAERRAQDLLNRMPAHVILQAAANVNMTVEAYRQHLLGKFKMGFLG